MYKIILVVFVLLFAVTDAYAGGGKGKHRGNGYGPYNQNHTYNHNSDSTDRNYNFDFDAADAFNFLGGVINQFNAPRGGYYAPPPQYYYRPRPTNIRYIVYYTIYNHGRRVRSGSIDFFMSDYESDYTIYSETYRRLGYDDYGVSINNHNLYCNIDQIMAR